MRTLPALVFCSGAAIMVQEAAWSRTLWLLLSPTRSTLFAIEGVFLLGAALGSAAGSRRGGGPAR